MKKILALFFIIFLLHQAIPCWALDYKGLHEEADKKDFDVAFRLAQDNPQSADDLYILALAYLNLHKDIEAEGMFRRLLQLDPQLKEARWGMAEILRRQGQLDESEKVLDEIIAVDSDFAPAYITLAYIKYTKLEFKKAIELARHVIEQGRDKVDLSNYTRAYLITAGSKGMLAKYGGPLSRVFNGAQVLPSLKKAQALQPESAAVLFGLGSFYFLAPRLAGGNINKALDYLMRAVVVDPLLADAYVRLAQIYKMKGDNANFEKYLNRALQIDPENALAKDANTKQCKFICFTLRQ